MALSETCTTDLMSLGRGEANEASVSIAWNKASMEGNRTNISLTKQFGTKDLQSQDI